MALYRIGSMEPATFAVATVLILMAVLLSSLVPARKAADSEPVALLREE